MLFFKGSRGVGVGPAFKQRTEVDNFTVVCIMVWQPMDCRRTDMAAQMHTLILINVRDPYAISEPFSSATD